MDTIYGTCDNYCQSIGCVCIGAWDDDLDTCGELGYYNCAHDFGSYTSNAICECNPQPYGTCPSGASPPVSTPVNLPTLQTVTSPSRPLEQCDETWWPDVDHDIVCGDCKVLVANMKTTHPTCSSYCSLVGRVCTGAWEENHDTCAVLSTETCDHDFGSYTSDAICECLDPGECNEHLWPDVDYGKVCGDCKVLVTHMDTIYSSCWNYCAFLGWECIGAWEDDHGTCSILTSEECNHDFGSYTSDAICQCGGNHVI